MKSHHYFQVYKVRLNSLLSCHYNDDYSEENAVLCWMIIMHCLGLIYCSYP